MKMAALTSSSCDDGSGRGYQVFLNFRGPDAGLTIADCLYHRMLHKGIRAFKDNKELQYGKQIEGSLLQAINDSKVYIPIFSENYASSKWCLRELASIVKLSRGNDNKVILPIFYGVDVDDVKLKTKSYEKAFEEHESEFGNDVADEWKTALIEATENRGINLKDHGLHGLLDLAVEEVSNLLWTKSTDVFDHSVGIKNRMDEIMKYLDLDAVDVRFIVIHGMGGIGKTTLAEAIFRQISTQFQGHCCFLKDVRTEKMENLQNQLLDNVLKAKCTIFFDNDGTDTIKKRISGEKVLIILDDIDNWNQIMKLAGEPNWYGKGSRIIITTRNIEYLVEKCRDDNHFKFYSMPEMNHYEALQLFCEHALGCAEPPLDYVDISEDLINVLGRLPLALNVVGSALRGEGLNAWRTTLDKLRKVIYEDVKKKLIISYETLDDYQKQIYLDIACFFIGQEITPAIKYWDACFNYPTEIEVKSLTRRSLIKVTDYNTFWMHDQLRDLGREIVRLEKHNISRLWSPKEAFHVVQREKGTESILALNLGTPEPNVTRIFKYKKFERLVNLRFLLLDHGIFEGDFKDLFFELRWLSWSNCPPEFSATNFGLENLTVLMLSGNNITNNWGGWCQIMVAKQLKVLQLKDCTSLMKTPKFSTISRLEILILRCTQLRKIDKSIGKLEHLDYLEIWSNGIESLPKSIGGLKSLTKLRIECQSLSELPDSIGNLGNLKHLILTCQELQKLPDSIGDLKSLHQLDAHLLKIKKLPNSIGKMKRLKVLCIRDCPLERLPNSIGSLQSLVKLDLRGSKISTLPNKIGRLQSLVKLDLTDSTIEILPNRIGNLKKLKVLDLKFSCIHEFPKTIGNLENLEELYAATEYLKREIPSEIRTLSSLKILDLSGGCFSGLPTTIDQLANLKTLILQGCNSIQQLQKLPKSLLSLKLSSDSLTKIPNFSNLTNLVILHIIGRSVQEEPKIAWIVELCALRDLTLSIGKMALPPTDFSSLSQLQCLTISYADSRSLTRLPSSLEVLTLEDVQSPIEWSLFSNLKNLLSLHIEGYSLGEIRFEELGKLPKFNALWLRDCPSLKTLPVLPCLKEIQRLSLHTLPKLTKIQGLGELKSLRNLSIDFCKSIKNLNEPDMSNLQNLKMMDIAECKSLESVYVPESCYFLPRNLPRLTNLVKGAHGQALQNLQR